MLFVSPEYVHPAFFLVRLASQGASAATILYFVVGTLSSLKGAVLLDGALHGMVDVL